MNGKAGLLLAGDIGGSNARFALAYPHSPEFIYSSVVQCADFENLEQAIDDFLQQHGCTSPAAFCLAAAGPLINQKIKLTNCPWTADARALGQRYGGVPVRLMNDFEAIAWSIAALGVDDVETIGNLLGELTSDSDFTVGVIGPGTGLGMAGLISRAGVLQPIAGEGGNVGFAPENELQLAVLQQLRKQAEPVSIERLVSGGGLEAVYQVICLLHASSCSPLNAAEIFAEARAGRDEMAMQSVEMFFEVLGQSAGNLALTIGAIDGIYIAGGIVPRYADLLHASKFRSGFENKGRYRGYMQQIPTQLIVHPQPGLLGASLCARQLVDKPGPMV